MCLNCKQFANYGKNLRLLMISYFNNIQRSPQQNIVRICKILIIYFILDLGANHYCVIPYLKSCKVVSHKTSCLRDSTTELSRAQALVFGSLDWHSHLITQNTVAVSKVNLLLQASAQLTKCHCLPLYRCLINSISSD